MNSEKSQQRQKETCLHSPIVDPIQKQRKLKDENHAELHNEATPKGIRIQANPQKTRKHHKVTHSVLERVKVQIQDAKENQENEIPPFSQSNKKLQRSSSQHVFQPSRTYYGYKNENRFLKQQK